MFCDKMTELRQEESYSDGCTLSVGIYPKGVVLLNRHDLPQCFSIKFVVNTKIGAKMNTYYLQPCPTCGRSLQVRIAYMGRKVLCRHCRASFIAIDPDLEWEGSAFEPTRNKENEVSDKQLELAEAF
ncbi:MAG: hypothetical protein ACRC2T_13155 [Thermoguttaceae bacterium]